MSVEQHRFQEENAGAYVLGALEPREAALFERHMDDCPVCRDEVERLRVAADSLARSVPQFEAPPAVKAALMDAVRADLGEAASAEVRPGRSWRSRLAERLPPVRPAIAVAAASLLLAGAVGGYAVSSVTDDGGARVVAAEIDKRQMPLASASLVVPDNDGEGAVLRVHGMPQLESNAIYQVWIARGQEVVSQSLFEVGPDGNGAAAVHEDLEDVDAVMVTREPAGGASAPSEKPILTAAL